MSVQDFIANAKQRIEDAADFTMTVLPVDITITTAEYELYQHAPTDLSLALQMLEIAVAGLEKIEAYAGDHAQVVAQVALFDIGELAKVE